MKPSLLLILTIGFASGFSACSSNRQVATTGDDMYFAPQARVTRVTQTTTTDYVTQPAMASAAPTQPAQAQPAQPQAPEQDYYQPNYSDQGQNGNTQGVPNGQNNAANITNNYYGNNMNAGYASPIGFYRPWYRPGISIGFGFNSFSGMSPNVGFGMANPYFYDPFWSMAPPIYSPFYDPFWGRPMVGWGVYDPFFNPYYNSFYNPYWYGYGYGFGYGMGRGRYNGFNDPYYGVYPDQGNNNGNGNGNIDRRGRAVMDGSSLQRPTGPTYVSNRPATGRNGLVNPNTNSGGNWTSRPGRVGGGQSGNSGNAPVVVNPTTPTTPATPATSNPNGVNTRPTSGNFTSRPRSEQPVVQPRQPIQPTQTERGQSYEQPRSTQNQGNYTPRPLQQPAPQAPVERSQPAYERTRTTDQGSYNNRPVQVQPAPAPNYYQPARRAGSYSENQTSRPRSYSSGDGGSRRSSTSAPSYNSGSSGSSSRPSSGGGGGVTRPRQPWFCNLAKWSIVLVHL